MFVDRDLAGVMRRLINRLANRISVAQARFRELSPPLTQSQRSADRLAAKSITY